MEIIDASPSSQRKGARLTRYFKISLLFIGAISNGFNSIFR
jgi:hypothetical protein